MGGTGLCIALSAFVKAIGITAQPWLCGRHSCCNFCRFQLNAGAGSRAGSSLGKGPVRVQGLLRCEGELLQGAAGLGTTSVRVLPAVPGWLQGMLRAVERVSKCVLGEEGPGGRSWPAAACDACVTLVRPRAAGVSQKEVPAPGSGFLQSRPAAPPPSRDRAVLPAARWASADVPWPPSPSRFPLATVPQYPTSAGPWLMAPSQHSLAQRPLVGTTGRRCSPRVVCGQQMLGLPE